MKIRNIGLTSRATRLALGLGLAGLLSIGGVLAAGHDAVERGDATRLDRAPAQARRSVGFWTGEASHVTAPCRFEPGVRMAYAVQTRTAVKLDMAEVSDAVQLDGSPSPGQQLDVSVSEQTQRDTARSWLLELEVVAAEADTSILAARITDQGTRSYVAGGGAASAASGKLAETFLIRVDARCGMHEFGWRRDAELEAVREQQIMVAGLGFWAPRSRSEDLSYGETSFDSSGSYRASYAYEAEAERVRGEIVEFFVPQTRVEVLASTIEVELAAGQWFASLVNERDLVMSYQGVEFGTHFRSTRAQATGLGSFAPRVQLDDGGWVWGRAPARRPSAAESFDPALAELSLDDVLEQYAELVAGGSISQYGPLLRDWLRANPAQTDRLLERLAAGAFDDSQRARGGLFFALGSANTPEARGALVGLLDDQGIRARDQILAAQALVMVEQPSEDMLDSLRSAAAQQGLHEVERGSLTLAVGSFARANEARAPELAAAARSEIAGWLDAPEQPEDIAGIRHSLAAAGNAGHDELAASIAGYVDHEDPGVRRSAAAAMRHMSPESAYPQLELGSLDDDRVVRTTALATAAEVARTHAAQPSEALTHSAIAALDSEFGAERGAAAALLDQAAKRGNAAASAALHDQLRNEIERGDAKSIAVLANNMSGRWTAPN